MTPNRPTILFVHRDGVGQFARLGPFLAQRGWQVHLATAGADEMPGAKILRYRPHRGPAAATHPYAQAYERAVLEAQGFARAGLEARAAGLMPDIVVSHAGTGAGLLARDVWPAARTVAYAEWWYRNPPVDLAYLGIAISDEQAMIERTRNAAMALEVAEADLAICPTSFQAAQFPPALTSRLVVHLDGVDLADLRDGPAAPPEALADLPADTPLVTYATRGMEPHRGFPQFVAALPRILAARPDAVVAIAGAANVAYGTDAMRRQNWTAPLSALDPARVRLLGTLPPATYRWLLRRTDAHVYLTVPFVLSWSLQDAMAVGAPLVLSDTPPVREIAPDAAALFVDFRDPEALADAVLATLADPVAAQARGAAARDAAAALDEAILLPRKEAMLLALMGEWCPGADLNHRHEDFQSILTSFGACIFCVDSTQSGQPSEADPQERDTD